MTSSLDHHFQPPVLDRLPSATDFNSLNYEFDLSPAFMEKYPNSEAWMAYRRVLLLNRDNLFVKLRSATIREIYLFWNNLDMRREDTRPAVKPFQVTRAWLFDDFPELLDGSFSPMTEFLAPNKTEDLRVPKEKSSLNNFPYRRYPKQTAISIIALFLILPVALLVDWPQSLFYTTGLLVVSISVIASISGRTGFPFHSFFITRNKTRVNDLVESRIVGRELYLAYLLKHSFNTTSRIFNVIKLLLMTVAYLMLFLVVVQMSGIESIFDFRLWSSAVFILTIAILYYSAFRDCRLMPDIYFNFARVLYGLPSRSWQGFIILCKELWARSHIGGALALHGTFLLVLVPLIFVLILALLKDFPAAMIFAHLILIAFLIFTRQDLVFARSLRANSLFMEAKFELDWELLQEYRRIALHEPTKNKNIKWFVKD